MKRLLPSFLYCLFIISTLQGQADHKETTRAWHAGSSARTVQSFIYTLTSFNATYTEITGGTSLNEGEIWDEPTYIMPLAFPFVINGNPVTELEFYGAGSLMRAPTSDPLVYNFIFLSKLISSIGALSEPHPFPLSPTPWLVHQEVAFK